MSTSNAEIAQQGSSNEKRQALDTIWRNVAMRIREPSYEGYRATGSVPLDLTSKEMSSHQDEIDRMLRLMVNSELSGHVADGVVQFTANSIMARLGQREGTNGASYRDRLYTTPHYDQLELPDTVVKAACEATLRGTSTMPQGDIARQAYGMASVEYANLTTIRQRRIEHLPTLEQETKDFLGEHYHPAEYRISIDSFDRDPGMRGVNHLGAMRVKAKRSLGMLPDGTEVKERTFAIIDTSQSSGFDQELVAEIISMARDKKQRELNCELGRSAAERFLPETEVLREWREHRERMKSYVATQRRPEVDYFMTPRLELALQWQCDRNFLEDSVLARNTTIYGYNKLTDNEIRISSS